MNLLRVDLPEQKRHQETRELRKSSKWRKRKRWSRAEAKVFVTEDRDLGALLCSASGSAIVSQAAMTLVTDSLHDTDLNVKNDQQLWRRIQGPHYFNNPNKWKKNELKRTGGKITIKCKLTRNVNISILIPRAYILIPVTFGVL